MGRGRESARSGAAALLLTGLDQEGDDATTGFIVDAGKCVATGWCAARHRGVPRSRAVAARHASRVSRAARRQPSSLPPPAGHLRAREIPGTEDALSPFFSPDGQWMRVAAQGKLKKVSITAGQPIVLADSPVLFGGSWGPDDTMVSHRPTSVCPVSRAPVDR